MGCAAGLRSIVPLTVFAGGLTVILTVSLTAVPIEHYFPITVWLDVIINNNGYYGAESSDSPYDPHYVLKHS